MDLSRRSQQKFADLCANRGTVREIEQRYEAHGFELPPHFEPQEGRARRSVCDAAEASADLADAAVAQRLLRVYVDAIEDFGRKPPGFDGYDFGPPRPPNAPPEDPLWDKARALVRSLRRDGAPIDENGELVLGAALPVLPIERFDRLTQPRVLLDHLGRIEAGIDADPAVTRHADVSRDDACVSQWGPLARESKPHGNPRSTRTTRSATTVASVHSGYAGGEISPRGALRSGFCWRTRGTSGIVIAVVPIATSTRIVNS